LTDVVPPLPGMYLDQASATARNVRAWIGRYSKLHPEPATPHWDEYDSNRVSWVTGVLDDLDRQLMRAIQSVNHHLPPTAAQVERNRRDERARSGLNRHRLKVAEDTTAGIAHWINAARWSEGVKPRDLDKLEGLTRVLAENLSHLTAQVQDEELAR
jgi:hypothetical protein